MNTQTEAIAAIEAQQASVKYHSRQWMAGEQLKDICRREPKSAALLAADLQVEELSIANVEKKIAEFARKNSGCASPIEAEDILREFYGLPERGAAEELPPLPSPAKSRVPVDLADFL